VKLRRTAIAFGGGGQTRLSLGGSKDPPLHDRLPGAGKNPGPRPPRLGITAARRTPSTRARRPQSSTVPTPSAG
jgi:hypothetical protein